MLFFLSLSPATARRRVSQGGSEFRKELISRILASRHVYIGSEIRRAWSLHCTVRNIRKASGGGGGDKDKMDMLMSAPPLLLWKRS